MILTPPEISQSCKQSFGHDAHFHITYFGNFIPLWSLPIREAKQDYCGVKGMHSKMNYKNSTELVLRRANGIFT